MTSDSEPPAEIVLMRLAAETASEQAFREALARLSGPAAPRVRALAAEHPQAWSLTRAVLGAVEEESGESDPIARIAAQFDRAAALSPEASVALYSFGDARSLDRHTIEIIERLDEWKLLGADRRALDLGCGIGRVTRALAQRTRHVIGLDISSRMTAVARARCADAPNVLIARAPGRGALPLRDSSMDLVLAVDSMPYIVQAGAGIFWAHLREVARILVPDGVFLILNFDYDGDFDGRRWRLGRVASQCGLRLVDARARAFRGWDAETYFLKTSG